MRSHNRIMDNLRQNLPYTGPITKPPTLEECPDAAGSIYTDDNGLDPIAPYTPPEICIGEFTISQGECGEVENQFQEELAAQALAISGANVHVFKLLGVHEQGKLVDLTGLGKPLGSSDTTIIYDEMVTDNWESNERGLSVVESPAFIGYDFGVMLTSFGQPITEPGTPNMKAINSFKISQPVKGNRALQVRVESSNGGFSVNPHKIYAAPTNKGTGFITNFKPGNKSEIGNFMLFADISGNFIISFSSSTNSQILGFTQPGTRFVSQYGSFDIVQGSIPFADGDSFMIPVELDWKRVDIVNLPNIAEPATIQIKQSKPSRYWRIVPTVFQGVTNPDAPWIVGKLQLFDVAEPSLDVIQDYVFMENRDRDYARTALKMKVAYTPFDAVSDLSKFGFQISDMYTFTTSFAEMVKVLGRPIIVGDVLELPSELQYDHNLKPVRKLLEVTDTGWSSDGYTTGWKPIIYKFQAQQLIPGQEHRDIIGDVYTQKFITSDATMFEGLQQIQTMPLTATEINESEAVEQVQVNGASNREFASGTSMSGIDGSYDGRDYSVEDGLPPDGQPYTTGLKLPEPSMAKDRDFFRLEYEPHLNIPARLYQFSAIKNKWIYIETDRRTQRVSHNKNQRRNFNSIETISPTSQSLKG